MIVEKYSGEEYKSLAFANDAVPIVSFTVTGMVAA